MSLLKKATKGILGSVIALELYVGSMVGVQVLDSPPFQKAISSQQELEQVIKEEAKNLNISSDDLTGDFYSNLGWGINKKGDKFVIHGHDKAGTAMTRNIVRHEIYHYYRDKNMITSDISVFKPDFSYNFYYLFAAEPRATLYERWGIKL